MRDECVCLPDYCDWIKFHAVKSTMYSMCAQSGVPPTPGPARFLTLLYGGKRIYRD